MRPYAASKADEQKDQARDRQPHVCIKRQAVGPSHAYENKIEAETCCQPQQPEPAVSPNPSEGPSMPDCEGDEEDADSNTQQRVQQCIRDVKK